MKAYIASHIFTPEALSVVGQIRVMLASYDFEVFSPYHASQEIWKGRAPKDCSEAERMQVLEQNVVNLDDSDLLFSWLNREDDGYDGRVDTGVAWENGYFHAMQRVWDSMTAQGYTQSHPQPNRPISLGFVHPDHKIHRKGINLMLTGTMDAVVMSQHEIEGAMAVITGKVEGVDDVGKMLRTLYSPQRPSLQEAGRM